MRLLVFLLPLTLFATTLKNKFDTSSVGEFAAYEQGNIVTLVRVHSMSEGELILEEVCLPSSQAKNISWQGWLNNGAPGNSSWTLYTFDRTSGTLDSAYSFSKETYLAVSSDDSLLSSLYTLPLSPLPQEKQKKIGSAPLDPAEDYRKVWLPPKIVDGKAVKEKSFDVFTAPWKHHGEGKHVEIYFSNDFPFPYWLHVTDDAHTFKVRAIDSGKNLLSPKKAPPKQAPQFIGHISPVGNKLRFTIEGEFSSYAFFAIDLSSSPQKSFPLHTETSYEKPLCHLDIALDELSHHCIKGHTYLFYATPYDDPLHVIEAPQTYVHN